MIMNITSQAFFVLLHFSTFLVAYVLFYLLKVGNKQQIHYTFILSTVLALIWNLGMLLEVYCALALGGKPYFPLVYFYSVGLYYMPGMMLITGIIYLKGRISFSWKYALFFVIPTAIYVLLIIEPKLLYIKYAIDTTFGFGTFTIVILLYNIVITFVGLFLFTYYAISKYPFFSKPVIYITIGSFIPVISNIALALEVVKIPLFANPSAISFTIIFFYIAIFRNDFLKFVPVAAKIADEITVGYVAFDKDYTIVDVNKALSKILGSKSICVGKKLTDAFSKIPNGAPLLKYAEEALQRAETGYGSVVEIDGKSIDVKRIHLRDFNGGILLFSDVTETKKRNSELERVLNELKKTQDLLIQKEKLAALGILAGGITHNLKTPLMAVSGNVQAVTSLINEYRDAIHDPDITQTDHEEIAKEMESWTEKIKSSISYMDRIISTVNSQLLKPALPSREQFTLSDVLKHIKVLTESEFERYNSNIRVRNMVNSDVTISGKLDSLIQALSNIISNALQAYKDKGDVILTIKQEEGQLIFTVEDTAGGIPKHIRDKLFVNMVTSKGDLGTGVGLYISNVIIKSEFGGTIQFETEEGEGTVMYISIPC